MSDQREGDTVLHQREHEALITSFGGGGGGGISFDNIDCSAEAYPLQQGSAAITYTSISASGSITPTPTSIDDQPSIAGLASIHFSIEVDTVTDGEAAALQINMGGLSETLGDALAGIFEPFGEGTPWIIAYHDLHLVRVGGNPVGWLHGNDVLNPDLTSYTTEIINVDTLKVIATGIVENND
jgi:hypothetical protein